MKYRIETIAQDNNLCGEAPTWLADSRCLLWVDLGNSLVYRLATADLTKKIISRDLMVAGIALNSDGRFVFAGATGLYLWGDQDNHQQIISEHDGEKLFFNDILADASGRLYGGTKYQYPDGIEKCGKLYLIDTDGSVKIVEEGVKLSNGLDLSPKADVLYFTDTLERVIYAYDVKSDSGALSNRRIFAKIPDDEGLPDGLVVDNSGYIWSAQYFGGQIVRYDPDGKIQTKIPMPVTQITSLCFGGDELTDLYVTTAGEIGPTQYAPAGFDSNAPRGGSLYRIHTDVAGKNNFKTNFTI